MAGYQPLKITGMTSGLVQEREEFILPNDAYPVLQNAFVWRERIKRKQGCELLGRLQRNIPNQIIGAVLGGISTFSITNILFNNLGISALTETNAQIVPGSVVITFSAPDAATFTDNGTGGFVATGKGVSVGSTVNYANGNMTLQFSAPTTGGGNVQATLNYYPNLPVMGLRSREQTNSSTQQTIAFDTKYAYRYVSAWQEFITGTTWSGDDSDFFWTTNYWVDSNNLRIFWATNFSGVTGDPIRYTNGTSWVNFAPQIDAGGNLLTQCLALVPFRGRLVAFNTFEGVNLAGSANFPQRIRWAAIGTPFATAGAIPVSTNANAWRDDIRGQGGFLDIPTSETIISVGFVRDNLVVYCENSTWQLRYTGRSIAPFQIEKVNSELGAQSTFSAVQFDTSLVGIGDKGVVECDSFKSERIDIKIPDLVFSFNNQGNNYKRVYGIRDFQQRLAYWTFLYSGDENSQVESLTDTFPNRRLVYNYENDSWAIFTDSFTCFGNFQSPNSRRWVDFPNLSPINTWSNQNVPWINRPALFPDIIAGNQQGFVVYLDSQVGNDTTLFISAITGNGLNATTITSPNHNLSNYTIVQISGIAGTGYSSLNNGIFAAKVVNQNSFTLWKYDPAVDDFTIPQIDASQTYLGGGLISVRDNFIIKSKKFNFLDDGQNIQMGYIDILMNNTDSGAVSLNVYLNYDDSEPINTFGENAYNDNAFNTILPTTNPSQLETSKNWIRAFCPVRGAFVTIEWTLSNAQMIGVEQQSDVQIDAQILWIRKAGKQLPIGV
jgi:hypothetical protein